MRIGLTTPAGASLPYFLLALFLAVSYAMRPLLPVDETRYLTVAWEMYLKRDFLVPTLNFGPYFQKPPLLFWLINLSWSLFGANRAAALLVVFAVSSLVIWLTRRLARDLFANTHGMAERMPWLVLGSASFVIYSSLILFDLLLTVFVLAAFRALIAFSRSGLWRHAALAGLFVGLGVLAKGPVMLLHIACPMIFYVLWRDPLASISPRRFLAGVPLIVAVAVAIVAAWLGPALNQTGFDFAYNLVWRQAAGRVSGSLESSHPRPFYFYLLLLPVVLLPWGFSTNLWRSRPWRRLGRGGDIAGQDRRVLRFLSLWFGIVFIAFSLISGKQPHYLVPLLPVAMLLLGYFMATIRFGVFPMSAVIVLALVAIGQAVASWTIFPRYDLDGLARFVAARKDADWGFEGNYQGQVTFLARIEKPFDVVRSAEQDEWLRIHSNGYLIARSSRYPDSGRRVVYSQPSERGYLFVLAGGQPP